MHAHVATGVNGKGNTNPSNNARRLPIRIGNQFHNKYRLANCAAKYAPTYYHYYQHDNISYAHDRR
jgi:hypothetical protein